MSSNELSPRVTRSRILFSYWATRVAIALVLSIVLACVVMALFSAGAVR